MAKQGGKDPPHHLQPKNYMRTGSYTLAETQNAWSGYPFLCIRPSMRESTIVLGTKTIRRQNLGEGAEGTLHTWRLLQFNRKHLKGQ